MGGGAGARREKSDVCALETHKKGLKREKRSGFCRNTEAPVRLRKLRACGSAGRCSYCQHAVASAPLYAAAVGGCAARVLTRCSADDLPLSWPRNLRCCRSLLDGLLARDDTHHLPTQL